MTSQTIFDTITPLGSVYVDYYANVLKGPIADALVTCRQIPSCTSKLASDEGQIFTQVNCYFDWAFLIELIYFYLFIYLFYSFCFYFYFRFQRKWACLITSLNDRVSIVIFTNISRLWGQRKGEGHWPVGTLSQDVKTPFCPAAWVFFPLKNQLGKNWNQRVLVIDSKNCGWILVGGWVVVGYSFESCSCC